MLGEQNNLTGKEYWKFFSNLILLFFILQEEFCIKKVFLLIYAKHLVSDGICQTEEKRNKEFIHIFYFIW